MKQHETLLGAGTGFMFRFWGAELGAILAVIIFGSPGLLVVQLIAPESMSYTIIAGVSFSVYVATRLAVDPSEDIPSNDGYSREMLMLFVISNSLYTSILLIISTIVAGLVATTGVLSIGSVIVALAFPEFEFGLVTRYQKSPIGTPLYYLMLGIIALVGSDVNPDEIPTFMQSSIIP